MKVCDTGRRAARIALAAAALLLAVAVPSVAFANTATFAGAAPKSASKSAVTRPTITVTVTDKYGVKGTTRYSMTLDGKTVKPSISYLKKYSKFRLTYKVAAALSSASHTVVVKVKDTKNKSSSYTWKFTVDAMAPITRCSTLPTLPVAAGITLTAADNPGGSGVAYTYYRLDDLPQVTYQFPIIGTETDGSFPFGPHTLSYWSVDKLGNIETPHLDTFNVIDFHSPPIAAADQSCLAAGCHATSDVRTLHTAAAGAGLTPNGGCNCCHNTIGTVATTDCTSCHGVAPQYHAIHVPVVSANTTGPADCTASTCHGGTGASVLTIHARDCSLCHNSPDTVTKAAVAKGGATCETCHGYIAPHTSVLQHAVSVGSCVGTGCHASNVTSIHVRADGTQACSACHSDPSVPPTTVCSTCHSIDPNIDHAPGASYHQLSAGGCVGADCHSTDVSVLHSTTPSGSAAPAAPGCAACHGRTDGQQASVTCSDCHPANSTDAHSVGNAYHSSTTSSCVKDGCHVALVTRIHNNAPHHCASCHATGTTPSTDCTTCHPSSPASAHSAANSLHLAPASSCVTDGCHPNDVTAIHASVDATIDGVHVTGCQACHNVDSTQVTPLTLDCSSCHGADLATIHGSADASHTASNGCTGDGCHDSNVSVIHENAPAGCQTCHATGTTPSTDCTSCHGSDLDSIHASAESSHTAVLGTCTAPGCHNQNVAALHSTQPTGPLAPTAPGCFACHGTGKTPSTDCTACHPAATSDAHAAGDASHTVGASTCVNSACHTGHLISLHSVALPGSTITPPGCVACHAPDVTPSQTCTDCHPEDLVTLHASADTSHTATGAGAGCTGAGCHDTNVADIHLTAPDSCLTCHVAGQTPTADCTNPACHGGDVTTIHGSADTSHATDPSCVGDGCHDTNVSVIHDSSTGGPGCVCHQPNYTLTTSCFSAGCHTGDISTVHSSASQLHATDIGGCTTPGCHTRDVSVIHTTTALGDQAPAAPGCVACHGSAPGEVTTTTCSTCHPASSTDAHSPGDVPHTVSGTCVSSECHYNSLSRIHNAQLPGSTIPKPGCNACHGTGITPEQDCSTPGCHTSTSLVLLHASADTSHTATDSGCVGVGCHPSNVSQIHVHAPNGCLTCHADGQTPTLDCTSCHGADVGTIHSSADASHTIANGVDSSCVGGACHLTNLEQIHDVATGGPGCVVCHGTGVGEHTSSNCTDVGCHSTDYASLHSAGDQAHFASPGTCATTGCHSGSNNVAAIHGSGPSCSACHAPGVTPSTVCSDCHDSQDLVTYHASNDASHTSTVTGCVGAGCHDSNVAALHLSSSNAIVPPGCSACHLDSTDTTPAAVPSTNCLDCHNNHVSIDHAAGNAFHTVPNGTPQPYGCVTPGCHVQDVTTIHSTAMPGHSDAPPGCLACHSVDETPSATCTDCHPSDARTVHAAGTASHTVDVPGCTENGCHATSLTSIHSNEATGSSTTPPECTPCHATGATPAQDCRTSGCHDDSATVSLHSSADAQHSTENTSCTLTGCHPTNVADVHMVPLNGVTAVGCVACHGNADHDPSTDCTDCHSTDMATLHPNADSAHIVVTSCNSPGCHDHDVRVIHGVAGGPGCAACHNATTTPTTDCENVNCHGGTVNGGDHTAQHAVCNNCHGETGHFDGPVVGATNNTDHEGSDSEEGEWDSYAQYNNCLACHGQGGTWTHPGTCHGCDGMGVDGKVYTGLW